MITAKEKLTEILCLYRSINGLRIEYSKDYIIVNPLTRYAEIFLRQNFKELFRPSFRALVLDREKEYLAIGEK